MFAYVIMPDHLHVITSQPNTSAEVLRYVKGIAGRRVIDYLKEKNFKSSLAKLRHEERKRKTHAFTLATGKECLFDLQRSSVYAKGQLHSFESGARRIG